MFPRHYRRTEQKRDQPAVIIGGRILLPLRAIGEALNLEVQWDGGTKSIILKQK
ncbi:MAG TPA: hypothetical protein DEA47_05675 [Peptococcaceae bacterium]|nr:hypothetical protein [Peptococcaceae bacterium]